MPGDNEWDAIWHSVCGPGEDDEVALLIEQDQAMDARQMAAQFEYHKLRAREDAKELARKEKNQARGPLEGRILTFEELRLLPKPGPLVRDVLYTGSVAVVLGDSQAGKTWVLLSIGASAASGMQWPQPTMGPVQDRLDVLYVAAEDGGSIAGRLECWERAHERSLSEVTFHAHPSAIDLLDSYAVGELAEIVRKRGYRIVIIDTVAASLGGEEETNHAFSRVVQHMRTVVAAMQEHGGGSVVLTHHFGKDRTKGARGGSSLFNDSDIVWELEGDINCITMVCKKWKTDSVRKPIHLRLDRSEPDAVHIVSREPDGTGQVSAEDPRAKYQLLAVAILKIVRDHADQNLGFGPSGRFIRGKLKEMGSGMRVEMITDQLHAMAGDGRLHTHPGPRGATLYRLPPVQDPLS